jgi:5-methylcytosine-specific restriction endonuclease McrA
VLAAAVWVAGSAHLAALALLLAAVVPVVLLAGRRKRRRRRAAWRKKLPALAGRERRAAYRHKHGREGARSAVFPERVKRAAKRADWYRCVYCGDRRLLEVDHFCSWAAGGRSVRANAMTLCHWCNRVKSDYWQDKSGHVRYHPWDDADNRQMAAAILAAERRARRNPARWVRLVLG